LDKRANLFSFQRGFGGPVPQVNPIKPTLSNRIRVPWRYKILVVVTARDCPPKEAAFIFEWKDFENVTLVQEDY
jgi:hypothetical protein